LPPSALRSSISNDSGVSALDGIAPATRATSRATGIGKSSTSVEVVRHRQRARADCGQLAGRFALMHDQPHQQRRQIVDMDRLHPGAVRHRHRQQRQRGQHAEHDAAGAIVAVHQRRPDDGGVEPARQQVGVGRALAAPVGGGRVGMATQRRHLHHAPHAEPLAGGEQRHRRGAVQAVEIALARLAEDADAVDDGVHAVQQRQPVALPRHGAEVQLQPIVGARAGRTAAARADGRATGRAQGTQHMAADQSRRTDHQHFHTASIFRG
jgi:hypothetical protein